MSPLGEHPGRLLGVPDEAESGILVRKPHWSGTLEDRPGNLKEDFACSLFAPPPRSGSSIASRAA
jgi:hypothetical protein